MGYDANELSGWLDAIHALEAALIAAGVEESKDWPDEDRHWFVFAHLLEVIRIDLHALPTGWEDEGIWDYDQDDRHLMVDLGEVFATFPLLFASSHPAIVAYRRA